MKKEKEIKMPKVVSRRLKGTNDDLLSLTFIVS